MNRTLTSKASVDIRARKWFDRVNGNTYHSVIIYIVDGQGNPDTLRSNTLVYGYGESWQQTAAEMLKANGYKLHAGVVKRVNRLAGYDILRSTELVYSSFYALHRYARILDYSVSEKCTRRELKELVS